MSRTGLCLIVFGIGVSVINPGVGIAAIAAALLLHVRDKIED